MNENSPHKVNVDETAPKVEAAGETGDDLEVRVPAVALGAGVKLDEVAGAGGGVSEDLGDLEGVGLDVLGEARPRERKVVAHEVVDGVTRDKG